MLTSAIIFRLMVRSRELRRDPEKWRTLLTNRTGGVARNNGSPCVSLSILCILPMLSSIVDNAQKGTPSAPVTTRVNAAPFILGGFYRTNDDRRLPVSTICRGVLVDIKRVRLMQLLSARGCRCLVNGVQINLDTHIPPFVVKATL